MDILFTSPTALIDKVTGKYFPGVLDSLHTLLEEKILQDVVVISRDQNLLDHIEEPLFPIRVNGTAKRDGTFMKKVIDVHKGELKPQDIIVLGASQSDFYMSTNSKTLMLTANYAQTNNPNGTIFNYGIPITDSHHLLSFFRQFLSISPNCYYKLEIDETMDLYAINSANYYYSHDEKLKEIKKSIESFLKDHNPSKSQDYLYYFLLCAYNKIGDLRNIDYWGVYPSSEKHTWNEDLVAFKEEVRKVFKTREQPELLIRHTDAPKRHHMSKKNRIVDGCSSQFETIIINPVYKGKLEGKTVCILDDFNTYGSSCETVRFLFREAGVEKIIFITMGKFGKEYHKLDYTIEGDVFREYSFENNHNSEKLTGNFYSKADSELKRIFKE